jgi:hypothetical protein
MTYSLTSTYVSIDWGHDNKSAVCDPLKYWSGATNTICKWRMFATTLFSVHMSTNDIDVGIWCKKQRYFYSWILKFTQMTHPSAAKPSDSLLYLYT